MRNMKSFVETTEISNKFSQKLTRRSRIYQGASRQLIGRIPFIPSLHPYNITISHKHRFIWFRVAKVGTRTIFDVLKNAGVHLDAEHAMDCRYPVTVFSRYFKFAFVRNPWDRLVSCWRNKVVDTNYFKFEDTTLERYQDFEHFVEYIETQDMDNCDIHMRLQSRLVDLNNIDFLGRFENFEKDLRYVLKEIGINVQEIPSRNVSSGAGDYRDLYSDDLRERVGRLYDRDIRIFAYEF